MQMLFLKSTYTSFLNRNRGRKIFLSLFFRKEINSSFGFMLRHLAWKFSISLLSAENHFRCGEFFIMSEGKNLIMLPDNERYSRFIRYSKAFSGMTSISFFSSRKSVKFTILSKFWRFKNFKFDENIFSCLRYSKSVPRPSGMWTTFWFLITTSSTCSFQWKSRCLPLKLLIFSFSCRTVRSLTVQV